MNYESRKNDINFFYFLNFSKGVSLIRTRLRRNLASSDERTRLRRNLASSDERTRLRRNLVNVHGATLIELILVVAIISILAATATSFGSSFLIRNSLENKTNEVVSSLRTAQLNAISSKEDRQWGVEVDSSQIKLFAVGDAGFDQTFSVPASISISTENIIFDKLTGDPDAVATITVSNSIGESNTVTVNEVGIVDVN